MKGAVDDAGYDDDDVGCVWVYVWVGTWVWVRE